MENPIMTLTMEDGGKIVAELYSRKSAAVGAQFHQPLQIRASTTA